MALTSSKRDWLSAYPGTIEFEGVWGFIEGLFIEGDQYGTGPIPMPAPRAPVPVVISEVPETWEALEKLDPELFEPILETRPGRVADSYPQDVSGTSTTAQDDVVETNVAVTWTEWGMDLAGSLIGNLIDDGGAQTAAPMSFAPMGVPTAPAIPGPVAAVSTAAMNGCDGMAWSGGVPPKGYKVVNHCGVGVLRKVRRRRRRRMLTASDAADIAAIVALVGKGAMAGQLINRR